LARFAVDFDSLSADQKAAFLTAVAQFVEDLRRGEGFHRDFGSRVSRCASGIFEMTWADDGRATFEYGDPVSEGEAHIIWAPDRSP